MGDIVLDDIDVVDGLCLFLQVCDFEIDICLWYNIGGDDFDWICDSGGMFFLGIGFIFDYIIGIRNGLL